LNLFVPNPKPKRPPEFFSVVRHIKIEYKSPKENANKENKKKRGVKLLTNFLKKYN